MRLQSNDEGSTGVLAYFFITVMAGLVIYMFLGAIFDALFGSTVTPGIVTTVPVSQERINILVFLRVVFASFPFIGIFLPNLYYAIIASLRQEGGGL